MRHPVSGISSFLTGDTLGVKGPFGGINLGLDPDQTKPRWVGGGMGKSMKSKKNKINSVDNTECDIWTYIY